ncbi:MAG: sulfite exporter TauE/SafE family protein [Spiribacter sp.]|nr:sulfite exporter TauE/SafE family protein [Spiribacter sp.]MDR9489803.1 sulfite exporter TauE/SafE family protein [Spiribacter sp.]
MGETDPMLIAGLIAGLAGSSHCIGMCGGIAAMLGSSAAPGGRGIACILGYNVGRIASYALIGAIAGLLGAGIGQGLGAAAPLMRLFAALLVILMGLQLSINLNLLAPIERMGLSLWQHIAPIAQRLMPVHNPTTALALGSLWGWLPCGLVYAMALASAGIGSAGGGAIFMLAFGLGTIPAMATISIAGGQLARFFQHQSTRRLAGLIVLALGVWTAVFPIRALMRL